MPKHGKAYLKAAELIDRASNGYISEIIRRHSHELIGRQELQQLLVAKGALGARVLTDQDSYPMSREVIEKAVEKVGSLGREIKQTRTVEDQSIFNLAVVMGCVPPKGVAMPFLSYGGSNLVSCFLCVGILLNLSRRKTR